VLDRLTTVYDGTELLAEYEYNANSQLISNARNDITTSYDYNELGQLTELVNSDVNSELQTFTYQYDAIGNIIEEVRVEENQTNNRSYAYDAANQLVEFTDNDYMEAYTYDDVGNMLEKTINSTATNYSYNNGNQLVQEVTNGQAIGYTYNDNGDLTYKTTGEQYCYDIQGNLISIVGNDIDKQYTYNGNGNRLSETTNDETAFYVNDLNRRYEEVLQTYSESGEVINTYTYGVDRISSVGLDNETYLYDGRGSVVGSVGENLMTSYAYTAYGELMPDSAVPNVYGYNGEATDFGTGMQYLRARYYDTGLGRFFQEDDYRGDFVEPQTMNRYIYVGSEPVNRIDPSGYDWLKNQLIKAKGALEQFAGNVEKKAGEIIRNTVSNAKETVGKVVDMFVPPLAEGYGRVKTVINSITGWHNNSYDSGGIRDKFNEAAGDVIDYFDRTPLEEKIDRINKQIESGNAVIPDAVFYPSDDGYYDNEVCMTFEDLDYVVRATGSQEEFDQLIRTQFYWDIQHVTLSDMGELYQANIKNNLVPVTEIHVYTDTTVNEISDPDALAGVIKAMGDEKHDDNVKKAALAGIISGSFNTFVGVAVSATSLITQGNNDEEAAVIDEYYDSLGGEYAALGAVVNVDIDLTDGDYKGGGTQQWYGGAVVTKINDDGDTSHSQQIMTEGNPMCGEKLFNLSEYQYNTAIERIMEGD